MGFNLWLSDPRTLESYYDRRFGGRGVSGQMMLGDSESDEPLFLNIDGEWKNDFTLDEIDSFVSGFKDLDAVRKSFRKFSEYSAIADRPGRLCIASRSDNIDKYQVVYDSPLLKKCAMVIREKRRKGLPEFLDRTPEMREYVQKLAKYATNKNVGASISSHQLIPPHVKKTLMYYCESVQSSDVDRASRCFENLFGYCMNYKTLRAFIIWEQEYLAQERKRRRDKAAQTREYREEEASVYRRMKREEDLRFMPIDSPVLEEINGMRDADGNIDFDRVYSQFDFDDVHSHSTEALQSIGLLPIDESKSSALGRGHKKK